MAHARIAKWVQTGNLDATLVLDSLQLDVLPQLPLNLRHLICSRNNLTKLPDGLPPGLRTLNCSYNKLRQLPHLPDTLLSLDCFENELTDVDDEPAIEHIPDGLTHFNCSGNQFQYLPPLPNGLLLLDCSFNVLAELDPLPTELRIFECMNNGLFALPNLPAKLTYFDCSINEIDVLPVLPAGLKRLFCNQCLLGLLPDLPITLKVLECARNELVDLPDLPASLEKLVISYNHISPDNLPVHPTAEIVNDGQLDDEEDDEYDLDDVPEITGIPDPRARKEELPLASRCFDPVMQTDEAFREFLSEDNNNIILELGPAASACLTRDGVLENLKKQFYACSTPDLANIKRDRAYVKLFPNLNVVAVTDVEKLLDRKFSVYRLVKTKARLPALVSRDIGDNPYGEVSFLSADHCQAGSGADLYTIEGMSVDEYVDKPVGVFVNPLLTPFEFAAWMLSI